METIGHVGKRRYRALARRASKDIEDKPASRSARRTWHRSSSRCGRRLVTTAGSMRRCRSLPATSEWSSAHCWATYEAVAAARAENHSSVRASWTVYQRMAYLSDRFEVIKDLPFNDRLGVR